MESRTAFADLPSPGHYASAISTRKKERERERDGGSKGLGDY